MNNTVDLDIPKLAELTETGCDNEKMKKVFGDLDKIFDEEGARNEADGIDMTIGNVWTFVVRCILRSMLGDELFYTHIPEEAAENKETFSAFMEDSQKVITGKLRELYETANEEAAE